MLSTRRFQNLKVRTGHPLMVGCTALYPLREDGGGTIARSIRDISGNNRHGTAVMDTVYPKWVNGYRDLGGLSFDGSTTAGGLYEGAVGFVGNDNVDFIPVAGGTISAWIRPAGTGPTQAVVTNGEGIVTLQSDAGGGNGFFRAKTAGGNPDSIWATHHHFGGGTADRALCADLTTVTGQNGWIHVIWQYDNTNVYGGHSGAIISTTASSSAAYLASGVMKLGKGNSNNFNGDISDVRFWNRVLSAAELRWLYDDPDDIYVPRTTLYFFQNTIRQLPKYLHSTAARVEVHADPEIASHCEVAKGKLLQQFKQKSKLADYICAFADRVQDIEQVFADMLAFRSLDTSVGVQMDMLGQNLNIMRNDYDDDKYRRFLNAKALAVGSQGRADQLITILETLDAGFDDAGISYTPSYPAGIIMHCTVPEGKQLDGEAYARILKPCAPATVQLILEFEESDVILFQYEETADDPTPDPDSGFEEEDDPGVGGILAEAV